MTLQDAVEHSDSGRSIDWLIDILRGGNSEVVVSRKTAPRAHVELERYTVFPSDGDPKLLISANSSRVRAASLRRVGSQSSSTMKLVRRIGAELARARLDSLTTPPEFVLSVDTAIVASSPGDREAITLVEHLEQALDIPGLHIAVTAGPLRPNRKPVVQVMDADGHLVAYAKVGWDPSTASMVTREFDVLTGLASRRFRDVIIPEVMHFGAWSGLTILITEPLDHPDIAVPNEHLVQIGLGEISAIGGVELSTLSRSAWLSDVFNRAAATQDEDLIRLVGLLSEAHGTTTLEFGLSHGDWAPWNMARLGRRLGVWDWERAVDSAPLGIDTVHHQFQQLLHSGSSDVATALESSEEEVARSLDRLGVDPGHAQLTCSLYLVELVLRYTESGLASVESIDRIRQDLLAELTRRVDPARHRHKPIGGVDDSPPRASKLFTRRMLGGAGVPAPIRDSVKTSVKTWGKITSDRRVLPNTFIIGGQRCGTTSLYRYLTQHPSVTGPSLEKGVHYFDTNFDHDDDWYRSHFPTQRAARLSLQRNGCHLRVVEACPYYSFHPLVAERMAKLCRMPRSSCWYVTQRNAHSHTTTTK